MVDARSQRCPRSSLGRTPLEPLFPRLDIGNAKNRMQQGAKSGTRSDGTALSKQYREWVVESYHGTWRVNAKMREKIRTRKGKKNFSFSICGMVAVLGTWHRDDLHSTSEWRAPHDVSIAPRQPIEICFRDPQGSDTA
jgi:hypothetical protein